MIGIAKIAGRTRELFPSFAHFLLFLRVALWLLFLPLLARLLSMPALMKIVDAGPGPAPAGRSPEEQLRLVHYYAIGYLNRFPKKRGKNCLRRSLLMFRHARMLGMPATFKLGVRKEGEALLGHAWLEIGGERLYDTEEGGPFKTTYCYPKGPGVPGPESSDPGPP